MFFLFSIWFLYSNVPCVLYSRNQTFINSVYLHAKMFKVIKRNSGFFVTICWSTHVNHSLNSNAVEVLVPQIMIEISSLFLKITSARQKFLLFLGWSPLCEPFGLLQVSAISQERLGRLSFPLQMVRIQSWNVLKRTIPQVNKGFRQVCPAGKPLNHQNYL